MKKPEPVAPAVLELGGYAWRPLDASDGDALTQLAGLDGHRKMHSLPTTAAELAAAFSGSRFRTAMACEQEQVLAGVAATTNRSRRNLNLHLVCLFREPDRAVTPLAMYVRHLFWLMPLHRIYAQLPLVAGAEAYVSLFEAAGFRHEGVVRDHALIDDQPYDVAVLGILRPEFDAWCKENLSSLAF